MTNLRYEHIRDALREQIATAGPRAGLGLPTEAELCRRFDASRSTVRRALAMLRDEGVIESRQGSGWKVIAGSGPQPMVRVRAAPSTQPTAITRDAGIADRRRAPPEVTTALGVRTGRKLLVVVRLSRLNGSVVHRSEVWFNPELSRELDETRVINTPPAKLVADHGIAIGQLDQFVQAVAASQDDESAMGLDAGDPVLEVVRTAFDANGRSLFQSRHRHPGNVTQLEIDLPRSDRDDLAVSLDPVSTETPPASR